LGIVLAEFVALAYLGNGVAIGFVCLAADLREGRKLHGGILFKNTQSVTAQHRVMLRRIPGENDTGILLFCHVKKPFHILHGEQPGFIDPKHLAVNLFLHLLVNE